MYALSDDRPPFVASGVTGADGRAVLYVPDGHYRIATVARYDPQSAIVWNFGEATIQGSVTLGLDDRDAVPVDFDPNKPGQRVASKSAQVLHADSGFWAFDIWSYPGTNLAYIAPTSEWITSYTYEFHPAAFSSNVTPEWAKLRYSLPQMTDPVTIVADWDNLVTRPVSYATPLIPDKTVRVQFVTDDYVYSDVAFLWGLQAPLSRTETYSPAPAVSSGWYRGSSGQWRFTDVALSHPAGAAPAWTLGGHPFNSGARLFAKGEDMLLLSGNIATDAQGDRFENTTRSPAGRITIQQARVTVRDQDIGDRFEFALSTTDAPETRVTIDGTTGLELSRSVHTELSFTANLLADYLPPDFSFELTGTAAIDGYNVVKPLDRVRVMVRASDDGTGVTDVALSYAVDPTGAPGTWIEASLADLGGDSYLADLGNVEDKFVSLEIAVTDGAGNRRLHRVTGGFRVGSRLASPDAGAQKPPGEVTFEWHPMAVSPGHPKAI